MGSSLIFADDCIERDLAKEYECPVCLYIMSQACELGECGHLICKGCMLQVKECPICRSKVLGYHISKFHQRNIANFTIKCQYNGCGKVIKLDNFAHHNRFHFSGTDDLINIEPSNRNQLFICDLGINGLQATSESYTEVEVSLTITSNVMDFVRILEWLQNYFSTITIVFLADTAKIFTVNVCKDMICQIKFKTDQFSAYKCSSAHYVVVKLDKLTSKLKTIASGDSLTIKYCSQDDELIISILHDDVDIIYSIQLENNIKPLEMGNIKMDYYVQFHTKYLSPFYTSNSANISFNLLGLTIKQIDIDDNNMRVFISKDKCLSWSFEANVAVSNRYYRLRTIIEFAKIIESDTIGLYMQNEVYPLAAVYDTTLFTAQILISPDEND
jgi:hypothetical protein